MTGLYVHRIRTIVTTGWINAILLQGDLNHEAQGTYSLTVVAVDTGAPNLASTPSTLTVNVLDLNEAPTLELVRYNLYESASANDLVGPASLCADVRADRMCPHIQTALSPPTAHLLSHPVYPLQQRCPLQRCIHPRRSDVWPPP